LADGFSERVIYRELFLQGLTLLDLANEKVKFDMKISHVAARQELRKFIDFLQLDQKQVQATDNGKEKNIVAA
jgi:chromosome partitioning protein